METGQLLCIVGLLVIVIFLCIILYIWTDKNSSDIGNATGPHYYNNYATPKKVVYDVYKSKQVIRKKPPNATFFSRVGGKETLIEGPYEEEYLDNWEMIKWKTTKRMEEKKVGKI